MTKLLKYIKGSAIIYTILAPLMMFIEVMVGAVIYLVMLYVLKVSIITDIKEIIMKRFRNRKAQ